MHLHEEIWPDWACEVVISVDRQVAEQGSVWKVRRYHLQREIGHLSK